MKKASLVYTLSAALTLVTTLSAADNCSPVENSLSSQNLSGNTLNKTASTSPDELAIKEITYSEKFISDTTRGDYNILSQQDKDGNTALHWAIINNLPSLALDLIEKGIFDLNKKNWSGQTPLHLISAKPFNPVLKAREPISDVLQALINKGADVNARNRQGDKPLHVVASTGFSQNAYLLIKAGAKVQEKGFLGKTPLQIAEKADNGAEIAAEIKRGINNSKEQSTNLSDSEPGKSLNKNPPMMPPSLWEGRK